MIRAEKGPIQVLCEEIGFAWDPRLERDDLVVAFVRELVDEIAEQRAVTVAAVRFGFELPPAGGLDVDRAARAALASTAKNEIRELAAAACELADELNPEEAERTDHLIDQLKSCMVALGFAYDRTYHSRHLAHASQHVFRRRYGLRLEDSHSLAWSKLWTCAVLQRAIVSLLPVSS